MKSDNADKKQPQALEPYEPPAIIAEEVFEVLALACAKVNDPVNCIPFPPAAS
jgi:hypothetical protein